MKKEFHVNVLTTPIKEVRTFFLSKFFIRNSSYWQLSNGNGQIYI